MVSWFPWFLGMVGGPWTSRFGLSSLVRMVFRKKLIVPPGPPELNPSPDHAASGW